MSRTAAGALVAVAFGCLAAVTTPSGASALTCEAATLTLPAVADAWIDELAPAVNRGSDAILEVETSPEGGDARALVRFAVPPVPAGCEVESARLRLAAAAPARSERCGSPRRGTSTASRGRIARGSLALLPPAAAAPAAPRST